MYFSELSAISVKVKYNKDLVKNFTGSGLKITEKVPCTGNYV
jgi:hypothetical protein